MTVLTDANVHLNTGIPKTERDAHVKFTVIMVELFSNILTISCNPASVKVE